MRYPLIHFAVLFGIAPLALGGCAQMTGGNLQRQVDANEQAIRQINSQLSGVQPAQADTWSQVQALRQEVAALRGDMDTMLYTLQAVGGAQALRLAMQEAGEPHGALYINAHGTGTPMNDKLETLAIKNALGEARAREALISSTKSMTGHMLGAAGGVEAIASVMALEEGVLPPTIHLDEPDPECDLNYLPHTALRAQAEMAVSLSLGFGGHNACVVFKRWEG